MSSELTSLSAPTVAIISHYFQHCQAWQTQLTDVAPTGEVPLVNQRLRLVDLEAAEWEAFAQVGAGDGNDG